LSEYYLQFYLSVYYPLAFDADIYAWTTDWVTKIHDI
jgi:hypothetical protein